MMKIKTMKTVTYTRIFTQDAHIYDRYGPDEWYEVYDYGQILSISDLDELKELENMYEEYMRCNCFRIW